MVETIRARISKRLAKHLEATRAEIAMDLKRKYKLDEITVSEHLGSEALAARLEGQKNLNIRFKKTGPNRGYLELL